MQHYLRPLLSPTSVAMVGASERPGSVGRTAFENLISGGFKGALHAVNPRHATVLGHPAVPTLSSIGAPVELAVVATPAVAVAGVLEDGAAVGLAAAVLMTSAPAGRAGEAWAREVRDVARRQRIRLVGAGAFGVIRTDIGLDATFCAPTARPGRLALVTQSGAVATALLDFAAPQRMGFSTVISLGTGLGVGVGELLDALIVDPQTDGILLYLEDIGDARAFMSALRSAARTKPVIVLKAGRSAEAARHPSGDAVYDAALRRGGAVRVQSYTQLFAAARILATGRIPRSDRLAIVSNGRGPALLAADSVAARGVELARFAPATTAALDRLLPDDSARANPVDLRGDGVPRGMAEAVSVCLEDPGVDAVLALHVARPSMPALDAAREVAVVARGADKPVLGAWLGALTRDDVEGALDWGGVVNFYTPENAVDAFSFLAAYRRNQAWLLEMPPLQPEPEPLDLVAAEALRVRLADAGRAVLARDEIGTLLAAFGIAMTPCAIATSEADLEAAASRLRFPLELRAAHGGDTWTRTVRTRAALASAWRALDAGHSAEGGERPRIVVEKLVRGYDTDIVIGVATDPKFGPVLLLGSSGRLHDDRVAVMLPPLSRKLAEDLVAEARGRVGLSGTTAAARVTVDDALVRLLLRVSTMVGALPWLTELALSRIALVEGSVMVGEARAGIDPVRQGDDAYRHMAIHPYPANLITTATLRDGRVVTVRPIRPEDGELEREFVEGLSPESRYFRFFYQLNELTPSMLARFTQVDYDREMALVAVADVGHPHGHLVFVGVARYVANPDAESAEFAVVVADAWQKHGVARALVGRLVDVATTRGFARLTGTVLRANTAMIAFVRSLGFTIRDDPDAPDQVIATLPLAPR